MSDSPRTDALWEREEWGLRFNAWREHACQLERELAEAHAEAQRLLDRVVGLIDEREKAEARCRELERDAKVGAAIERGARELPNGAEVEITIEQGAASVYLRHVCGETVCIDVDSDTRLATEIHAAIDAAIESREGRKP